LLLFRTKTYFFFFLHHITLDFGGILNLKTTTLSWQQLCFWSLPPPAHPFCKMNIWFDVRGWGIKGQFCPKLPHFQYIMLPKLPVTSIKQIAINEFKIWVMFFCLNLKMHMSHFAFCDFNGICKILVKKWLLIGNTLVL